MWKTVQVGTQPQSSLELIKATKGAISYVEMFFRPKQTLPRNSTLPAFRKCLKMLRTPYHALFALLSKVAMVSPILITSLYSDFRPLYTTQGY